MCINEFAGRVKTVQVGQKIEIITPFVTLKKEPVRVFVEPLMPPLYNALLFSISDGGTIAKDIPDGLNITITDLVFGQYFHRKMENDCAIIYRSVLSKYEISNAVFELATLIQLCENLKFLAVNDTSQTRQ
jgi:hypothetical protein